MVTTIRKYTGGAHPFLEFACLSTDTKPVDLVPDNSICHEIDTGKKYYFANKAWHEAPSRGGSSGGGSGGGGSVTIEPFYVEATITEANDEVSVSFNKTLAQTKAAFEAGQGVFLVFDDANYPVSRCGFETGDEFFCWPTGDVDERAEVYMFLDEQTGDTIGAFEPIESGKGGGAEKFVVTLTQDEQTEEWTADKTIAEIVAADEANQVVVAKYPGDGLYVELPISVAASLGNASAAMFFGLDGRDSGRVSIISVMCMNQGSGDVIQTQTTRIPTSSNAPLIVTMTEDEQTPGTYVGDKTYGEALSAFTAGKTVHFNIMNGDVVGYSVDCISLASESGTIDLSVYLGSMISLSGSSSDYISTALN